MNSSQPEWLFNPSADLISGMPIPDEVLFEQIGDVTMCEGRTIKDVDELKARFLPEHYRPEVEFDYFDPMEIAFLQVWAACVAGRV